MKLAGGSLSPGLSCPPRYFSVSIDFEHPTKDAHPERRSVPSSAEGTSGAEGFLSFPPPSLTPFRMNTYRKQGEGGGYRLSRHLCFTLPRNRAQRTLCFQPLAHSLHTLLHRAASHLLFFQWFAHSLLKHGGYTPDYSLPRRLFPRGQTGTHFLSLRLPPPYVLSFLCGLCASVANLFFLFLACRRIDPRAQPLYS